MKLNLITLILWFPAFCFCQSQDSNTETIQAKTSMVIKKDFDPFSYQHLYTWPLSSTGFHPVSFAYLKPTLTGFFCKAEYKADAYSKLAPRFRLGSLNYTDWMEGKKEIYMRYWK